MGLCTAPDNVTDECSDLGKPCILGLEGEHCCLDSCGRKYCTAKDYVMDGDPALVEAMIDFSTEREVPDIMVMVTTEMPTVLPDLETEEQHVADEFSEAGGDPQVTTSPTTTSWSPTRSQTKLTTSAVDVVGENEIPDIVEASIGTETEEIQVPSRMPTSLDDAAGEEGAGIVSDADDAEGLVPSYFTCVTPEIFGLCTAPDPDNSEDECSDIGKPCLNGVEGEYCCLDFCQRKYCTAKGAPTSSDQSRGTLVPSSVPLERCTDTPNWVDSLGDTCAYYRTSDICESEGYVEGEGTGTAIDNCCTCGGGIMTTANSAILANNDENRYDDEFALDFPLITDDSVELEDVFLLPDPKPQSAIVEHEDIYRDDDVRFEDTDSQSEMAEDEVI